MEEKVDEDFKNNPDNMGFETEIEGVDNNE